MSGRASRGSTSYLTHIDRDYRHVRDPKQRLSGRGSISELKEREYAKSLVWLTVPPLGESSGAGVQRVASSQEYSRAVLFCY